MASQDSVFLQNGNSIDHTPVADVTGGDVVVVGNTPFPALSDIAAGVLGALQADGVFKFAQVGGAAGGFSQGDALYWDANGTSIADEAAGTTLSGCATSTAGGNTLLGMCSKDSVVTDTWVEVRISSAERTATIGGAVTASSLEAEDSTLDIGGLDATVAGDGGLIAIAAGRAHTNGAGGLASVTAGAGSATGTGAGGVASLVGGESAGGATGAGGAVAITGGAAGSTNGAGGAIVEAGGAGTGTGVGGSSSISGGAAAGSGDGGNVVLTGGTSGTGVAGGVVLRGDTFFAQDAPSAEAAGAQTIAAADFVNGIVVHTVTAAATLTTPTGAEIAAVLPTGVTTGDAFRLHVITVGAGGDDISTLTAGDGDVTFVGDVTVGPAAAGTSSGATWIFRMTGATSFVGYRVG